MYGLISKIVAQPGHRDKLAKILLEAVAGDALPGCLSYIVAVDSSDSNSLWVTEVWQSREDHAASLALPSLKAAMNKGRNLIASFSRIAETTPVGGLDVDSSPGILLPIKKEVAFMKASAKRVNGRVLYEYEGFG